ncbi:hypothetical protein ACJ4V0_01820 [Phreatobacter sp. HK31-P]
MMNRASPVLSLTLLLLIAAPLAAPASEVALADALRRCAGETGVAERLACFDGLAASLATPEADGAAVVGRWEVKATSTPAGREIIAEQRPVEPWGEEGIILQVACREGRAVLGVGREIPVMNTTNVFATVRINDRLAPGDIWEGTRDRHQALYPGNVREFLQQLPATGTLSVRLEGSRRWRFEGTYQLDGIADIRRRILAACVR